MVIKGLIDEDFINYKKPSMVIEMPYCNFKCDKEYGQQICQNSELAQAPNIEISTVKLIERYINNPITKAVVFQGLEPFDSYPEVWDFIYTLRTFYNCDDDIVIYTGYNEDEKIFIDKCFEVSDKKLNLLEHLSRYKNIIIKFGRYNPKKGIKYKPLKYDEVLGVELASRNQYAKKIS